MRETPEACLRRYLSELRANLERGDATEHTHRSALKSLVESLRPAGKVVATNEPRRERCGAPDYSVAVDRLTVGYIEAKIVGAPLDTIERDEQIQRYRRALPNLVLTDYLQFRWYVNGALRETARLGAWQDGRWRPDPAGQKAVLALLSDFLDQPPQDISTPRELAERLARLAQMIRDVVIAAFKNHAESADLRGLRRAFAQALLPDLEEDAKLSDFADMYAQTLAYGLFAARCHHRGPGASFQRLGAAAEIPKTNPFLRRLFESITGTALDDEPHAGFVDDLVQVLAHADIDAILREFGRRTRQEDPVVHFYETFLAAYDPKLRELRGVYYTPEPVVSYIVRSVDHLLRTRFGLPRGLADEATVPVTFEETVDGRTVRRTENRPKVLILDPACGTGTFLYAVIDLIRETFRESGNAGMWPSYVREHLLPRLYGFELLMAPYTVAHLKLGLELSARDLPEEERDRWAYDFTGDERLNIFLTNTLEDAERHSQLALPEIGVGRAIAEEARGAAQVKRDLPIMVVIGNPPYSGHSANASWTTDKDGRRVRTFIGELIEAYKEGCPELRKAGQAKWLHDDYVKFLRWAEERLLRTGSGILAMITNHGYLENPTFRGMRRHLQETFDEIWVLDLHGSSKKREVAPDGTSDENVFDIQQGVAICLMVRRQDRQAVGRGTVRHQDLWGPRATKYEVLAESSVADGAWRDLSPTGPQHLFRPQSGQLTDEVAQCHSLPAMFAPAGDPAPGIVTTHDEFAVSWSPRDAAQKVEQLLSTSSEAEARRHFRLCSQSQWSYDRAKRELASGTWRQQLVQLLYRPFDARWTVYNANVAVHRRERVSHHMLAGVNVGLITTRQTRDRWDALVTRWICGHKSCGAYDINYLFPLYLYPDPTSRQRELFAWSPWPAGPDGRAPNLAPEFVQQFTERLGLRFEPHGDVFAPAAAVPPFATDRLTPEDIFAYVYAIFHAPSYRERYAEFLRIDFPRVPITADVDLFRRLVALGRELVLLHLLEAPTLDDPITTFPQRGDNRVEKGYPKYAPTHQRVRINPAQYFEGVREELWEFHIGGYQVLEKWLKDRRGQVLTHDDLRHYQRVVKALAETIRLMGEVDEAIEAVGGWPLP